MSFSIARSLIKKDIHFPKKHLYFLYFDVKPIVSLFPMACFFVKVIFPRFKFLKKENNLLSCSISTGVNTSSCEHRSQRESRFAYAIVSKNEFY